MEKNMFDMSEYYRAFGQKRANPIVKEGRRMMNGNTNCTDPLTMVFINPQPLDSVYPTAEAFMYGTLFPNLNKPFYGGMQK